MKYSIKQNWLKSLDFIVTNPIVLLPFTIIALVEGIMLEFIYFSTRRPISLIAGPIIRKFFGEQFLHYPDSLLLAPSLLYYLQIGIYCVAGVFLAAISINIFKTINSNATLKPNVLIKNSANRYLSFIGYGILSVILIFLLKRLDLFILSRIHKLCVGYAPNFTAKVWPFATTFFFFLTNIILQTFLILTVPIIVLRKRPLLKALFESISTGLRNFPGIFTMIFLPFLFYLPISILKTKDILLRLADMTSPEICIYLTGAGIIVSIFVDCFVTICAAQFLLDREGKS